MNPNKKIVIVGAGPAGMLLAWLLIKKGFEVAIIERHHDFSREFRGEGIQASVMKHLEDLGLMDDIMRQRMGVPAEAARVFFNEKQVAVIQGIQRDSDFGIILHQEKFLQYLHDELCKSNLYHPYLGHTAVDFIENKDIKAITVRDENKKEQTIAGDIFCITSGRGTALRKKLGLVAKKMATHWNILWILLPTPQDPSLIPNGFRAYLNGKNLFILYTNAEGMIQMAWSRKDESILKEKDFEKRKAYLMEEIPTPYKNLIREGYAEKNRSQFLKVESDRLDNWHYKNVLFLGDAAHTMSPVAGQGINLAMRDSIVAANHLVANRNGVDSIEKIFRDIQQERIKEIMIMQKFQQKFGYFMLGAPIWQSKIFFFIVLPILTALGLKKRMMKMVQGGVSVVNIQH